METRYQFIVFAEARWLWFKLSAMFPGIENKIPNVLNVQKSCNEKHKSSFYTIMLIWADLIYEVRIGCFCLNSVFVLHVLKVSHTFSTGAHICVNRNCFEIPNPFSWAEKMVFLFGFHLKRLIRLPWPSSCMRQTDFYSLFSLRSLAQTFKIYVRKKNWRRFQYSALNGRKEWSLIMYAR